MIKTLRRRHFQAWIAIAVLLPAAIVFSWLVIPNDTPVKLLASSTPGLLPIKHEKKETLQYCVSLRSDKELTAWQIEWTNKLPLATPSAVIYRVSQAPSKQKTGSAFHLEAAELIGRIEARGNYVFPIKNQKAGENSLRFVIYDFIHEKIIDTISFSKPPYHGGAQKEAI